MREEKHFFEGYELTAAGTVRPSSIMRRLQEIAGRDLDSFGVTYQDLRDRNMAFVISKIAIDFQRPLYEKVLYTITTSAQETHGATFPRSFVISDEKGVVCRVNSLWALLDFEKRKLLRATALGDDLVHFPDLSDGLSCERLFKPKDQEMIFGETRKVYASMLDRNHHLNNCNYADLATDLFPEQCGSEKEIHITFQKEARLADEINLEAFSDPDGVVISGEFSGGEETCFLCKIKYF
ncbi:MAG: hypothetical protein IKU24_04515 [Clostridia bacterium]|nr:hypothetical protein [Clostridia bacterium]